MLGAVPHERANAVTGHDTQTRQRIRKAGTARVNVRVTAPVNLLTVVVTDAATAEMSCAESVERFHPKRGVHHGALHSAPVFVIVFIMMFGRLPVPRRRGLCLGQQCRHVIFQAPRVVGIELACDMQTVGTLDDRRQPPEGQRHVEVHMVKRSPQ